MYEQIRPRLAVRSKRRYCSFRYDTEKRGKLTKSYEMKRIAFLQTHRVSQVFSGEIALLSSVCQEPPRMELLFAK